ncbi:unnamed protein product [Pedinophyceae sp. YPF-701]|nr:unnamed protein product [Pedinophyceae sp. YPF-701]
MSMRLLEEAEQVCTEGLQLAGLEHHTTGDDEEAPKIDVERCVLLEKQCYDATKLIFRRCRIREKLGRTAQALEDAAACAAINPASATFRLCLEDLKGPYTRSATSCHGGSSREVSAAGSVSADSLRTVGDDSGAEGTLRKLLTRK